MILWPATSSHTVDARVAARWEGESRPSRPARVGGNQERSADDRRGVHGPEQTQGSFSCITRILSSPSGWSRRWPMRCVNEAARFGRLGSSSRASAGPSGSRDSLCGMPSSTSSGWRRRKCGGRPGRSASRTKCGRATTTSSVSAHLPGFQAERADPLVPEVQGGRAPARREALHRFRGLPAVREHQPEGGEEARH
jgi:hypothetical protein